MKWLISNKPQMKVLIRRPEINLGRLTLSIAENNPLFDEKTLPKKCKIAQPLHLAYLRKVNYRFALRVPKSKTNILY